MCLKVWKWFFNLFYISPNLSLTYFYHPPSQPSPLSSPLPLLYSSSCYILPLATFFISLLILILIIIFHFLPAFWFPCSRNLLSMSVLIFMFPVLYPLLIFLYVKSKTKSALSCYWLVSWTLSCPMTVLFPFINCVSTLQRCMGYMANWFPEDIVLEAVPLHGQLMIILSERSVLVFLWEWNGWHYLLELKCYYCPNHVGVCGDERADWLT